MTMNRDGVCDEANQVDDELPPEVSGSRAAYERFSREALRLAGPFSGPRVNLGLVYHNVSAGVGAVLADKERIEREIPGFDCAQAADLPELVLAVIYAAGLIDRNAPTETREKMARANELRGKLLPAAEVLANAGLLPTHEVARIRKGTGSIDTADDLVALARLFTDHADAIRGKTAITAVEVREASDLGTELRTLLRPAGARKAPMDAELSQALENRDRLFTLLVERYDLVRRAGAWIFGLEKVGELVPTPGSRVRVRAKAVVDAVVSEP